MSRKYATELTKEMLINNYGIEYVSKDGQTIIGNSGKELKQTITIGNRGTAYERTYKTIQTYDKLNRTKIPRKYKYTTKDGTVKTIDSYTYKTTALGVHRLVWVWYNDCQPAGMIVDHIDNNPLNNNLENLQLLSPSENVAKDRKNTSTYELKCNLNKPRSFYENKLEGYTLAYEQAKKDKDAKAAHLLRTNIAHTRARLRYYDRHIDEYLKEKQTTKPSEHECHARAEKRRELQANVDSSRKFYKEVLAAYGKDDPIVKQYWYEWKMAIAMLNGFKEECKKAKQG